MAWHNVHPEQRNGVRSDADADAELARRIRMGDSDAFTTVFLAQYDGLCRFAESYVRNAADAEEIVEDVLARVWEQHQKFDPSGSIGAYLYAAVRNRALNAMRDARVRVAWETSHEPDMELHGVPGMLTPAVSLMCAVEREELGVLLRRAIDSLPEHRRAVVTMRWFGGLTHTQIAAALGTSSNAVEVQLRRALKELAVRLPAHLRE